MLSHSPAPIATFLVSLVKYCLSDLSLLISVQDEIEAAAKAHNMEAEQTERDVGFVSSRTATVRGAIASLGNMAIAEDMDFSTMFAAIDVRSIDRQPLYSSETVARNLNVYPRCRGLADRQ